MLYRISFTVIVVIANLPMVLSAQSPKEWDVDNWHVGSSRDINMMFAKCPGVASHLIKLCANHDAYSYSGFSCYKADINGDKRPDLLIEFESQFVDQPEGHPAYLVIYLANGKNKFRHVTTYQIAPRMATPEAQSDKYVKSINSNTIEMRHYDKATKSFRTSKFVYSNGKLTRT